MRAFIRQYASAVGLDGNQLVDIYDGKEPAIVEEPKPVYEELEGSRKQLHDEEKQSSWLLRKRLLLDWRDGRWHTYQHTLSRRAKQQLYLRMPPMQH